jgi:cellulose synthase/poly-beta-1,6-N-acetylglucosamine synthase-like glycosyltransferase
VVFVDSDCVVRPDFLSEISRIFARDSEIAIAGCKVRSPQNGHWTEVASDDLHRESGDGRRSHINSGCMAIRREVFEAVGGFSPVLPANEDYDLCDRVRATGQEIWQFESLSVLHLGNPKTIAGFMRRLRWHGRGAFSADGRLLVTPMSLAVIANSAFMCGGVAASAVALAGVGWAGATGILLASITMVPVSVWLMRMKQYRRWIRPHLAIPLMQLTLIARQLGMLDQFLMLQKRRREALP